MGGGATEEGKSLDVDLAGNIYVVGSFAGTADFDPGPGTVNLTSLGGREIFIAKYNPDGGLIWAKKIGGTEDDSANSLRIDANGNLYLIGSFKSSVDFDPNAGTAFLNASGLDDIFIAKYSSSGVYQWAKKIGGIQSDIGNYLELDTLGNLTITGHFHGQPDFDPGPGAMNLSSAGGSDAFFAKFTNSGLLLWANRLGGTQDDSGVALQIDDKGYLYLTGKFNGIADFDPSAIDYPLTSNGLSDVFLSCYDAIGNFAWANSFGGSLDDSGNALDLGPDGRIYLTGSFQGNIDVDPSAGIALLTGFGGEDIFLACYDTLGGNHHWAKRMGGLSVDRSLDLKITDSGDIYLIGHFSLDGTFATGIPSSVLSSLGGRDMFIGCYNLNGDFKWANRIGGTSEDSPNALLINGDGSLYLTGYFRGTVDFDPSANESNLTSSSIFDIFTAKYYVCQKANITQHPTNLSICENGDATLNIEATHALNYSWQLSTDGGSIWTTISDTSAYYIGANTQTLNIQDVNVNQYGFLFRAIAQSACGLMDTSAIASLNVLPITFIAVSIGICLGETYVFPDGTSSDTSTTHFSTLQSINGCDSIVVSILVVYPQYFTAENIEICSGETYIFPDGTVSNISTNHTSSFLTENGCDSLIATNLIVIQLETELIQNGSILTFPGSFDSIQWVNCDNNHSAILGATGPVFAPNANGNYAAIIYNNNCSDTSDCYFVLVLGTDEESNSFGINVYPNPANDIIEIDIDGYFTIGNRIQLINAVGNTVLEGIMRNSEELIDISDLVAGVYWLQITQSNRTISRFVVKK